MTIPNQGDPVYFGKPNSTKISTSPLTSGVLFNITGAVEILEIIGTVTTIIQNQPTTVKLRMTMDALAAVDLCATLDINAFAVGSVLGISGINTDPMLGANGVAVLNGQSVPVKARCIAAGTLSVVFGAASTGAITWEILWIPINANGNLVAA